MTFRTDRAKVLGLGSAKSGADHWFGERLKSVALIPLTIIFVLIVAPLIGKDHATVIASFQNPFVSISLILFFLVSFKHLEEGLQVVIEDYVHSKGSLLLLIIFNKLFCWTFGLAAVFAILKITFAG
ncbi:succinate dehydrogenase, hydrophobic membrane anchor protein [Amylibacter sp.]|jgi:succinate dehydrogenase / fumarate reductase membrane anchor subunit|nr:succinate dehydrogenase, hydrophobic membrane anchor protein [Rhodobacterales bacterium]MCO4797148.1 succinate dehydrogenase, hydrophobic membrane anchor protein [Amylibacter sp.]MBT4322537.1 succinate dehydrogenase, hydrophobic membrane anchor protein [Rhodobacterales bacterium]MBT4471250.1 succinate dehydrogenase, hydrophobic membrane anchor protein [Rhodobacterales bacterium]MBT6009294.1 succinate dehydrogenase, hydrophobic membrane anchor protein [Rhodobacterales bacterium]|tara:strand:+ start:2664 stop:3044 length:381 start_codon:yes stop_codon:yes gene_type:complete